MELLAPAKNVQLQALMPDIVQSCILFNPVVTPTPELPAPVAVEEAGIITPVPPTVTYEALPAVTILEDNSPDQIIGCLSKTGDNPQPRLSAMFPGAVAGNGVVARDTNDIWVYDGSLWENVGPNPGPRIVVDSVIPPYNLAVSLLGRTSTKVAVRVFNYAFELFTQLAPVKTSTKIIVKKSISLLPTASNVQIGTSAPSIITGFSTTPDPIAVLIGRQVPTVSTGISIQVPSAGYLLETYDVDVPRPATRLNVNPVSIDVAALDGNVSSGASASVPLASIAVAALTPGVNGYELVSTVGTKTPILGVSSSTATHVGWTSLRYGTADDDFVQTPDMGFNFTINGSSFSTCFVGSNGYITFGQGSVTFSNLSASNPSLNKLFFVPGDRSYQRVSFKTETDPQTGTKLARIRWEGSPGTGGIVGSSGIIVEITLFEAQINGTQFIELVFGNYTPSLAGFPNMLIASTTTSYVTPTPGDANTSWVFQGDATGTSWTMTSNRYISAV